MLELYHFALSTCSQKVRLVLAEKNLEFVSHEVDLISGAQHDPDYVRLNPKHVVPTLVHDGGVLIESAQARHLCDRHVGVGADGVLTVLPSEAGHVGADQRVLNWRSAVGHADI